MKALNRCSIMRHRSEKSRAAALLMRLVYLTMVVGPLVVVSASGASQSEYLQRPTSRPLLLPYSNAFHSILCIRGGQISPYQQKVPPRIQGWSGQQFTDGGSRRPTTTTTTTTTAVGRMEEEGEPVESDVSTREAIDAFLTRDSRNSFIARVYSILSVQLIITAISCFLFGLNPVLSSISQLSRNGEPSPWAAIPLVGILASSVAWFRVCASPDARRKSPNKWWWLTIFTAGEALSVGFISSFYKFRTVVTAMGATAVATLAVSLYTIKQNNPNRDLSQIGASLSSWAMILLSYLMIGLLQKSGVLPRGFLPFSDMLYSGFAACLFSAFLAHHTKLIVAGKHAKYRMNDKDYVFGAMALYTDVVGIFLNILEMLGKERDR